MLSSDDLLRLGEYFDEPIKKLLYEDYFQKENLLNTNNISRLIEELDYDDDEYEHLTKIGESLLSDHGFKKITLKEVKGGGENFHVILKYVKNDGSKGFLKYYGVYYSHSGYVFIDPIFEAVKVKVEKIKYKRINDER